MRTKSVCLVAAALVGGLLTAAAQSNVYSLNVVGYVNTTISGGGYTLLANPLDDGNGNVLSNLVPAGLPIGSKVLTWNGSTYVTSGKKASGWSPSQVLAPGMGFFVYNPSSMVTNTFVGEVSGDLPGSLTNSLASGYSLVGSLYPIGGNITNTGSNTINLPAGLPVGSKVLTWNGSTYVTSGKKASGWSPAQTLSVGQGFFIQNASGSAVTWIQDVAP